MARKIKIDNAMFKRFERKAQKRQRNIRNKLAYFLIVSEGVKTEPYYFESIRRTLPQNTLDNVDIEGAGKETLRIVDEAISIRDRAQRDRNRFYDHVWAVFDKDSFPNTNFDNAIHKGKANKIQCAWSNEAFELWYLLHFQNVENAMSRVQYRPFIERELSKRSGQPFVYAKNRADMYDLLKMYGDEEQAIKRAEKLVENFNNDGDYARQNPCTKVHELIKLLNDFRQEALENNNLV